MLRTCTRAAQTQTQTPTSGIVRPTLSASSAARRPIALQHISPAVGRRCVHSSHRSWGPGRRIPGVGTALTYAQRQKVTNALFWTCAIAAVLVVGAPNWLPCPARPGGTPAGFVYAEHGDTDGDANEGKLNKNQTAGDARRGQPGRDDRVVRIAQNEADV